MIDEPKIHAVLSSTHEAVLQAWDCVFAGTAVIYLSGPITTGKRYTDLILSGQESDSELQRVVRKNSDDLKSTAIKLRSEKKRVVLEPASLSIREWSQKDYLVLWERLIEAHADVVLFMPSWEYSVGCTTEFVKAISIGVRTETVDGLPITLEHGQRLMAAAKLHLESASIDNNSAILEICSSIEANIDLLNRLSNVQEFDMLSLSKDAALDFLANTMNVAQFVSFFPVDGKPVGKYSRISGEIPNWKYESPIASIELLLKKSLDGSVNVRSFEAKSPQSREFIYGLQSVSEVMSAVERLSKDGLHTIVNETIDVHDGGVSGVLLGDILEFSPDDTPRCVEKPGTASLPRDMGVELLSTVYGMPINFDVPMNSRLEFSLHPKPCGWLNSHVLVWEYASHQEKLAKADISWPNNFSKMIGDKAYGLLVAHLIGLPVPFTTVVGRRVAPFSFGSETGLTTNWIRTSPKEQVPGKFTTQQGWIDPFALLSLEDPSGDLISSVLCQRGVSQTYSGALIVGSDGGVIIEGKAGEGETFMLGESSPELLPECIIHDVKSVFCRAKNLLGPVRFEWVHDGIRAWVVQLHVGATRSSEGLITDYSAMHWCQFDVSEGLEKLRVTVENLPADTGIVLSQRVGLTSHFADVLRRANVPAKMVDSLGG